MTLYFGIQGYFILYCVFLSLQFSGSPQKANDPDSKLDEFPKERKIM